MEPYVQGISVAFVFLVTLIFFKAVSPQTRSLLFSRKAGAGWQDVLTQTLGSYLSVTSIFGTLTSLATVYVFFIGSAKIFGWVAFICCISLMVGAKISNYFSARIAAIPRVSAILQADKPTGALVTALFWEDKPSSKQTAFGARWISMAAILGILWLEFSVFGDISGLILGLDIYQKTGFVFVITLLVSWFTFNYGLRGFIFADILHAALIALACVALFAGVLLITPAEGAPTAMDVFSPLAQSTTLIVFACHVLFLNAFLVLTSESHWLRMWLFSGKSENKEISKQYVAQILTALVWGILICVGLLSSTVTGNVELGALSSLLGRMSEISPIFLAFFWLGATAALFSTSDMQFYCLALLRRYDWRTGKIPESAENIQRPFAMALLVAFGFATAFAVFRLWQIPIEKLVFTIVPLALNLTPNLVQITFGKSATLTPMLLSICGYTICSAIGFIQPEQSLNATLAAALVPAIVSGCVWNICSRGKKNDE